MTAQDILEKPVHPYPGSLQRGLTFREHAAIELLKGCLTSGKTQLLTEDIQGITRIVNALAVELAKDTPP